MKSKSPFRIFSGISNPIVQTSLVILTSSLAANAATFTWDGGGTDTKASNGLNWVGDAAPLPAGYDIIFSGTSTIGTTVNWDYAQNFRSLTFDSAALAYTISGATPIQFVTSGIDSIVNNSANTQTITDTVNVFFNGSKGFNTGSVAGGSLALSNIVFRGDSMASGTNTLTLTGSNNGTIGGTITRAAFSGTAVDALTKSGTGTWTLNGAAGYTGVTTITGGLLRVNSTNTTSAVNVTGGALGGTGSVTGAVTINGTGGTNLINGTVGTLALGNNLSITGAAGANNLKFDLGAAAGGTDKITVAGTTSVTTAGAAVINLNQIGGAATRINAGTYTLLQGAGTMAGVGQFALATTKAFGSTFALGVSGNNLQITTTQAVSGPAAAYWAGGSDAWSSAANWNTDAASGVGTAAVPGYQTNVSFSTTTPVAANLTTNAVDADFDVNSLNFNSLAGGVTIGGSNMLTLEATNANGNTAGRGITSSNTSLINTISAKVGLASSQTWSVASGGSLTVSGAITDFGGAYSLSKAGSGTLTLSGTNSFTGGVNVDAGTLALVAAGGTNNNIAAGSVVNVANGAGLYLNNVGTAVTTTFSNFTLNLNGGNSLNFGNANIATFILPGNITLTGTNTFSSPNIRETLSLTGLISGSGNLVFLGGGAQNNHFLKLSGANTYTGSTAATSGAGGTTIQLVGGANRLPTTTTLALTSGNSGTYSQLDLNANNQTLAGLTSAVISTGLLANTSVVNSNTTTSGTLNLNIASGNNTFGGVLGGLARTISGSTSAGDNLALTKSGAGTLILTGTSTYTGITTISDGTLQFGDGTTGKDGSNSGSTSIVNSGNLAFNRFNTTSSYSGVVSGTGSLTKLGVGTQTLTGDNTYTGATTLSAGILSVATIGDGGVASSNLGSATNVASNLVFGGGTLQYTGATASTDRNFTINALSSGTIDVSTNTLTMTGSAPTTTGTFYKTGAGSLVLDPGAGSYSVGALSANGGTLVLKSGTFTTTGGDPAVSPYNVGAGARGGSLTIDGAVLNIGTGKSLKVGANSSGTLNILSGTVTSGDLAVGHNGTVVGTQSGGDVTVTNLYHQDSGSGTYTLSGGTLTVKRIYDQTTVANSFTLNLNGGTLKSASGTTNLIDNAGTLNQVTVLLGTGNTVIDTTNSSASIVRPMGDMASVAGGFTKAGVNTLTLAATNTYTGATQVNAGTLLIGTSGSLGATAVTVGGANATSSPTLAGGGTIGGATVIAAAGGGAAGIHSPGVAGVSNGVGTQTFSSTLNYGTGSLFEWNLNASGSSDPGAAASNAATGSYDQVVAAGAITGSGAIFKVILSGNTFDDAFWNTNKSWSNIFGGAGTPVNLAAVFSSFSATGGLDSSGVVSGRGQFTFNETTSTLNWSAVPEPTSALAGLLIGAGLLRRRRGLTGRSQCYRS